MFANTRMYIHIRIYLSTENSMFATYRMGTMACSHMKPDCRCHNTCASLALSLSLSLSVYI
jgi:hypothetical protein